MVIYVIIKQLINHSAWKSVDGCVRVHITVEYAIMQFDVAKAKL